MEPGGAAGDLWPPAAVPAASAAECVGATGAGTGGAGDDGDNGDDGGDDGDGDEVSLGASSAENACASSRLRALPVQVITSVTYSFTSHLGASSRSIL